MEWRIDEPQKPVSALYRRGKNGMLLSGFELVA
jgi:hypothetical protein